jgi:hypothetical protein
MKNLTMLLLLITLSPVIGQVGIGTMNPQADLHIAGDALVQTGFTMRNLVTVATTDKDFKLVTRVTDSNPVGEITTLDVGFLNVAPINVVDYSFTNIQLDNIRDVDLQYDPNKYIVGVANFRHVGDAIKKIPGGETYSIGHFVVRTFISGGTWHLEIRNVDLDLDAADSIDYYITLIVYDKSYFRYLAPITTNLGGSNTGSASSIPNLY